MTWWEEVGLIILLALAIHSIGSNLNDSIMFESYVPPANYTFNIDEYK